MSDKTFNIAIVGLGFGAEFIPIHQAHPNANLVAVCRRNEAEMNAVADEFNIEKRYTDYDELLKDPEIDAVHINSPIPDHAPQSIKALRAGKHVMCTVPMATTIEECEELCKAVDETGLKYMMAETVVYSREFLFIKELYDKGELGKLQYLAASHPQDMDGWPSYWEEMIPMHYATHVVSPCLGMVDGLAEYVSCFGSGTVRDDIAQKSGNKFAVESCHIKIKDSDLSAHIWRFLYDVAGSTARALTCTVVKRVLNGPSSKASRASSTWPSAPRRRFLKRWRFLITPISCPSRSRNSRSPLRTQITSPLCKAAATAAVTLTWSTNS